MSREYFSQQICALDGVMICMNSSQKHVSVPARAGDMPLYRLGGGALCLPEARTVTVEEGYTAVSGLTLPVSNTVCSEITLPSTLRAFDGFRPGQYRIPRRLNLRRTVSSEEYGRLLALSEPAGQGFRLLGREAMELPQFRLLIQILNDYYRCGGILNYVNPELPLFFGSVMPNNRLTEPVACMRADSDRPVFTENDGVLQRIAAGRMGTRSMDAERANDRRNQMGVPSVQAIQEVSAIGFSEAAAVRRDDQVFITLTALTARYFNQLLRQVVLGGKTYYVYSRRFLTGREDDYQREDVCVYGPSGMIPDRELSARVYSKYRLLNML